MSFFKKTDIFSYKKYNISFWENPPFIFFVLGILIIGAVLATYFIGSHYLSLEYLSLIVIALAIILLSLSYIIVNSFQHLADANLMKTEFMNIISHELKTPLTNLKWTTELAINGKNQGKEMGNYFEVIYEQNERMLNLINNMLVASRIEQRRWRPKKEKIDLKKMTQKAVKKFGPTIKANNIKVNIKAEQSLRIFEDPFYINQVIENLLDNAISYSKGNGRVDVIICKRDGRVKFSVRDEGVGIPKEEQKKIFQKFFRSSNVLRHQTKGLGLSLFIMKLIINQLHGKVGFKSKEGKGSVFWFELPIK